MRRTPVASDDAEAARASLFAGCEVIVSVPGSVVYSPNYAAGSGGAAIVGKFPRRLHVGLRVVPGDGKPATMRCGESYTFIPDFEPKDHYHLLEKAPVRPEVFAEVIKGLDLKHSLELVIWSEFPFQRGLNAAGALATATAAALCIFTSPDPQAEAARLNRLAERGVAAFWKTATGTATAEPGSPEAAETAELAPVAKRVFRLAVALETAIYGAAADGHFTLACLLDSKLAVVFTREPDPTDPVAARKAPWLDSDSWWASGLDELWTQGRGQLWPFAIALLFAGHGDPADPKGILTTESLSPHVAPLRPLIERSDLPIYGLQRGAGESLEQGLLHAYRQASVACSVRVLQTLHQALMDSTQVEPFCAAQDRCQGILQMLDRSPDGPQRRIQRIKTIAAGRKISIPVGIRFQEYGRYGYLLLVGPPVDLRKVRNAPAIKDDVHWYYEPEQLPTVGLRADTGTPERIEFRLLRNGTWSPPAQVAKYEIEAQRLHLLVRGRWGSKDWDLAWCQRLGHEPNYQGETYAALSGAMDNGTMPDREHLKQVNIRSNLLPTAAMVLAMLSDHPVGEVVHLTESEKGEKVRLGTRLPAKRALDSIQRVGNQCDDLLQMVAGRTLGLLAERDGLAIDISLHPPPGLLVGIEILP
jgi:hypothetical protein